MTMRLVSLAALVGTGYGHGMLVSPPARNAVDRFLPQFLAGQSPQTPCTCPNANSRDAGGDHGSKPCDQGERSGAGGQPCLWWSQGCTIGCDKCTGVLKEGRQCNGTMEPTLPKWAWTMNVNGTDSADPKAKDAFRYFPWRAPGYAPVVDPCGKAGGSDPGHGHGGDAVFTTVASQYYNASMGDLGTKVLPYSPSGTKWMAGSAVEVSWAVTYNHGGGYQYRLHKMVPGGRLTERGFQQLPLAFDRTKQALLMNNGTRFPLPGVFVDKGTWPKDSAWARNPIPRQGEYTNGATRPNKTETDAGWVEFPPPCPWDCSGQPDCPNPGSANKGHDTQQNFAGCSGDWRGGSIVDTVLIPADLEPGQWVLGWRWDCEETSQIWQSCADVTICKEGEPCTVPPAVGPHSLSSGLE